ncbi:MAG: hypothetical protein IPL61_08560 [Myxococcales bacterium]|nr:hypothetical protein [Myxococcales bacterium]
MRTQFAKDAGLLSKVGVAFQVLVGIGAVGCQFERPTDVVEIDAPLTDAIDECDADVECGVHQYCDEAQPSSGVCRCVAGYSNSGTGCAWTGTVAAPGFSTQAPWTTTAGVVIDVSAIDGLDPGTVEFQTPALCALGSLRQTIEMPTYAKAEPLVLEVTFTAIGPSLGISLAGAWTSLPADFTGVFATRRLCLGEAGYAPAGTPGRGAALDLVLSPMNKLSACTAPTASLRIDRVDIVAAHPGECGPPGAAPNGDAEGAGGWEFIGTADLFPNAGAANTRGVVMYSEGCGSAIARTQVNIPAATTMAAPAVEFYSRLSAGAGAIAELMVPGGALWRSSTAGEATTRICLPTYLRGQSTRIQFEFGAAVPCAGTGHHELVVDNLRIVDDPRCGGDALLDPGFESAPLAHAGGNGVAGPTALPAGPHGGDDVLELATEQACQPSTYYLMPIVPDHSGSGGAALSIFHRIVTSNTGSEATIANVPLTETGTWTSTTTCLDPDYVGRPEPIVVQLTTTLATTCGTAVSPERAWFDDAAVINDPACP